MKRFKRKKNRTKRRYVIVEDTGYLYSKYEEWAEVHGLKRFKQGRWEEDSDLVEGKKFKIICEALHGIRPDQDGLLYGIEDLETGRQFIIGAEGVKETS